MLAASELILNPDGSIYHLNLQPDQLADTIITVGDPERVATVSRHFDRLDYQVTKREFVTHTGELNGQRLMVISTGIGPDNIDIVLTELDALANIDFQTRLPKTNFRPLSFIRLGTSGALQPDIPVDAFLSSAAGIGLDNLLHFYPEALALEEKSLSSQFVEHLDKVGVQLPPPYAYQADAELLQRLSLEHRGITLTCPGFYGPQGRQLRLSSLLDSAFFEGIQTFRWQDLRITNFEMETAAILGMAKALGHRAVSLNAILANRPNGTFSQQPKKAVERLIVEVLERLTGN